MTDKIYRLYGINIAIELLRPKAKWEIYNNSFTKWEDPRPCPTIEEVHEVMELSKKFEDNVNTIWLSEQIEELEKEDEMFKKAMH